MAVHPANRCANVSDGFNDGDGPAAAAAWRVGLPVPNEGVDPFGVDPFALVGEADGGKAAAARSGDTGAFSIGFTAATGDFPGGGVDLAANDTAAPIADPLSSAALPTSGTYHPVSWPTCNR